MKDRKESLREKLRETGFDVVRFARVDGSLRTEGLQEWLDRGMHAEMDWMKRTAEKRMSPHLVLDGVKSVIVCGVNYWRNGNGRGENIRWARYSLHRDYHDTINEGFQKIELFLQSEMRWQKEDYRFYVDAGSVMERAWGVTSGVGFQGKNGMLISQKYGNWLLLGCLLSKEEFVPDEPLKKESGIGALCGKCTKCMNACPTEAIVKPGVVDARKCISYHTIENKGSIPLEIRPKIGNLIFGCDICLDVCPWNRFAQDAQSVLMEVRNDIQNLSLQEILEMTPERFQTVFKGTAMKRLKLERLLRNACIVAGNIYSNTQPIPSPILNALYSLSQQHNSEIVREHAQWALGHIYSHLPDI